MTCKESYQKGYDTAHAEIYAAVIRTTTEEVRRVPSLRGDVDGH